MYSNQVVNYVLQPSSYFLINVYQSPNTVSLMHLCLKFNKMIKKIIEDQNGRFTQSENT